MAIKKLSSISILIYKERNQKNILLTTCQAMVENFSPLNDQAIIVNSIIKFK